MYLSLVAVLHMPLVARAACSSGTFCNPLKFGNLVEVLVAILEVLLIIAVPIIIFFIVLAGFYYVTAQGNATKIQEANRALLYALIGGAIILGARVIGAIIAATVGSRFAASSFCAVVV